MSLQSWTKFLAVTQILLIQFFFDLVTCFCCILKNYKPFIRFKHCYRQMNQIYAKCQYLQCSLFFFMTAAFPSGMLHISLWAKSWLLLSHSCLISAHNLWACAWNLCHFQNFWSCLHSLCMTIETSYRPSLQNRSWSQ